ncbi:unnamed protein product [Victoria cruziana]
MPKMKTKSSAKKRFKITATGKVKAAAAGKRHGMIKRTNKFIRDARGTMVLAEPDGKKHKKVLKQAKGFYGRRKNTIRTAKAAVDRSKQWAYKDRKINKRNFRALWIQRINAAVREHGLTYGRFIDGLNKAGIEIDRKVLSDMAIHETEAFAALVAASKKALEYLKTSGTAGEFEGAVR